MAKNNEVYERREANIKQAVKNSDWDRVSNLLNQPLANAERRDRRYGLFSLNKMVGKTKSTEFGNLIPDKQMTPLDLLLTKKEKTSIYDALETLSDIDKKIIIAYVLEDKSYSKIAKEIGLSDKTVKKRYVLTLQLLKELLE